MAPLLLLAVFLAAAPAPASDFGSVDLDGLKKGAGPGDNIEGKPLEYYGSGKNKPEGCEFASDKAPWTANGWTNLKWGGLPGPDSSSGGLAVAAAKKLFTLNAVILNDSGWTLDLVGEQMNRLARIYKTCGIRLTGTVFVMADSPIGKVDLDGAIGLNSNDPPALAAKVPDYPSTCPSTTHKPLLFFFRSFKDKRLGWSYPASILTDPVKGRRISDTSWLPSEELPKETGGYGNAAHELAHVLGLDHTTSGEPKNNLMHADATKLDGTLTSAQCATMLKSGYFK